MCPVSVFAKAPGSEMEQLRGDLYGRWRQAARAVMVLLSLHGLPPSQVAELLTARGDPGHDHAVAQIVARLIGLARGRWCWRG
jgi:hypothetical protein